MDLIQKVRNLAARVVWPDKYNTKAYANFLRKKGCHIGKGNQFGTPVCWVDITRPWLVSIGDYCKIGSGVLILTHDYSISVLRMKYKEIFCEFGFTRIGNNVFIGMNSIILKGVTIGDNCIIGAGSVVTHDIPANSVAAGMPAKVLCSLDEHYERTKQNHLGQAKDFALALYDKNGRPPTIEEMGGFYPLYLKRDLNEIKKHKLRIKFSGDDYEDTVKHFLSSKPVYETFEQFLDDALVDRLNGKTMTKKMP